MVRPAYSSVGIAVTVFAFACSTQADPAAEIKLPMCKDISHEAYFPVAALARNQQGRVLVEFTIDVTGRTKNRTVITSEPSGAFAKAALAMVSNWRCDVAPNWSQTGASDHRFRASIVFQINGNNPIEQFTPNDTSQVVRRSPIPGAK